MTHRETLHRNDRSAVTAIVIAALLACSTDAEDRASGGFTIRDSVGIQIVTNTSPAWRSADAWRIDASPSVTLGGDASDIAHLVWQVRGAARLSDGRIAVLSGGRTSPHLLLFTRNGALARRIGRPGRGPGEFVDPVYLQHRPGDTLIVWERDFGAVTSFDTAGNTLAVRRLDLARLMAPLRFGGPSDVRLPLPDGSFVAYARLPAATWSAMPVGEWYRPPIAYVRIRSDYRADTLGIFQAEAVGRPSQDIITPMMPLSPVRSSVAASWDADEYSIFVSNGDSSGIHVLRPDGSLTRIVRVAAPPLPLLDDERRASVDRMAAFNNWDPQQRAAWQRYFDRLPPQRFHAPMTKLIVDRLGFVWARNKSDDAWGTVWSVFDPTGRWLGRVPVPLFDILEIGSNYVLGVARNDLLVESVREHRLER